MRTVAILTAYITDRLPRSVELAIPIETDPWLSEDHLLRGVGSDVDMPAAELNPGDVSGAYMQTRDPLPPFGAHAAAILDELRLLDHCVMLDASASTSSVLIPLEIDGELAAVLDLTFEKGVGGTPPRNAWVVGALVQPLAAIVLNRDRHCRAYESLAEENRYWRQRQRRHYLFKDLIAESEAMRELYNKVHAIVELDSPVIVVGEAGSGKALLARALHHLGPRTDGMLTSLNCRELRGEELDFELFGAVANDLSGDVEPRKGIFELADGGTVFLEEVDQLSLLLQGKLLRVLREGEVRRIGDAIGRRVDVRVVASTHRNLSELVSKGRFRRDLYLAMGDEVLHVPPLRHRRADILPLARTFVRTFARRYDRACARLGDGVGDALCEHLWEGNVRELQSVVEAAVLKCDGEVIEVGDLGL